MHFVCFWTQDLQIVDSQWYGLLVVVIAAAAAAAAASL
jgi:hypothetical protein